MEYDTHSFGVVGAPPSAYGISPRSAGGRAEVGLMRRSFSGSTAEIGVGEDC